MRVPPRRGDRIGNAPRDTIVPPWFPVLCLCDDSMPAPRFARLPLLTAGVCLAVALSAVADAAEPSNAAGLALFETQVHPVLAGVCFRCHGDQQTGGALRVDSRDALLAGGDSGPAIIPGKADESLLVRAIRRADDVSAMPPEAALKAAQVAGLVAWINAGAPWPEKPLKFEAAKHWSYQPVIAPAAPEVQDKAWHRNDVDRFILAKVEAAGQKPAPEADRRTLIRRLTYDLTGLPPTPAEVAAFEADTADGAYERVVERLLKSPHYGEQWGRHWLDVVRYADTAGENTDHPLPHAWRYRNWVIDALNADMPYDQFVREQIAGDLLAANDAVDRYSDHVVATGFLAIARRFGHDIDKDVHLTYEDTIDTLGKAFLGLSVACARCHDHKYDPISQRDYYGLYGVLASTKFAFPGCEPKQQPRDLPPRMAPQEIERLTLAAKERTAKVDSEIKRVETAIADAAIELKKATSAARVLSAGKIDDGGQSDLAAGAKQDLSRVELRQGETLLLEVSPQGNHGGDSTLVELKIAEIGGQGRQWNVTDLVAELNVANPRADQFGNAAVWCFLDMRDGPFPLPESLESIDGQTALRGWRNGDTPSVFANRSDKAVKVWTSLPAKQFFVHPGPNGPVGVAWTSPADGTFAITGRIADAHPTGPDGVGWQLTQAQAELARGLVGLAEQSGALGALNRDREKLGASVEIPVAYGVSEAAPQNSKIQLRGDPATLGDEVPRKFLEFLGGARLDAAQSSGRLELAQQLTNPRNPLVARVIANRVWLGHFGRGLVKTPNDFGSRGARPTHPELVDYLASTLVREGWSLKSLHRAIVTSATYRQASAGVDVTPDAAELYVGFPRRRLSAEEIRDSLLMASGELDRSPGEGHPFPPQDKWNFTQHGPFAAEYDSTKRSVYLMQKRNRRTPFFALFDGADPNASTPLRDVTTVPTQALYFLNDRAMHAWAGRFAERVLQSAADDAGRIDFACRELFARPASAEDQADAAVFLQQYAARLDAGMPDERARAAWQAYARVLLASNEFLSID